MGAEKTWCGGVDCTTANVWSRVHVGEGYSEEFEVVGVHQGSVLSLLLSISLLEALS